MSTSSAFICDEMSEVIVNTAERIALENGVEALSVRRILQELGITNRVFYNRFGNIEQVLEIIYEKTVLKIRQSLRSVYDPQKNFFEEVIDIVTDTLVMSYENKMNFNQYVFYNDSRMQKNYEWWKSEIEKIIEYAKENHYIKNVDTQIMSYSIWCFIRGYNADALGRNIPKDEAVKNFRYSFGILLEGMKAEQSVSDMEGNK